MCGAFNPISEAKDSGDRGGGGGDGGMKAALHAISLFEEFKKCRDLHDAFRRLVRLSIITSTFRNSINRKIFDCRKNCAIMSTRAKQIPMKTKYGRKTS